jgi:osmotically-inducible protein OsmY
MRIIAILLAMLLSAGCTSMLLGNNSSAEQGASSASRDETHSAVDDKITAAVIEALSEDKLVSQYSLAVRTVNGYVIVSGTVGSYTARDRAIEIASNVEGPTSISYRIGVNTRL